jgi:hypothetical protein
MTPRMHKRLCNAAEELWTMFETLLPTFEVGQRLQISLLIRVLTYIEPQCAGPGEHSPTPSAISSGQALKSSVFRVVSI